MECVRQREFCQIGLTSVAELRAGQPCRPPAARWLPRPTSASERAKCSQRDAVQLLFRAPANGPRVSSSAKLGGLLLGRGVADMLFDQFLQKFVGRNAAIFGGGPQPLSQ